VLHEALLAVAVVAAGPAEAQSVWVTVTGDAAPDRLGSSLDRVGDVNGDGVPDFIAGMYQFQEPQIYPGKARVYSGLDGTVLHEMVGDDVGDAFGPG
jgi:hypothetical protein